MSEQPPTMTPEELAERLGVDSSTVFRRLRVGELPGFRVGSRWVIDRGRVERFIAGHEDAAGRPLIEIPFAGESPALTLLPERRPDPSEMALIWLRGAQAALELLVTAGVTNDLSPSRLEEGVDRRHIGA